MSFRSRLTYTGQSGPITAVAGAEDGQSVASASGNGSLHVWRVDYTARAGSGVPDKYTGAARRKARLLCLDRPSGGAAREGAAAEGDVWCAQTHGATRMGECLRLPTAASGQEGTPPAARVSTPAAPRPRPPPGRRHHGAPPGVAGRGPRGGRPAVGGRAAAVGLLHPARRRARPRPARASGRVGRALPAGAGSAHPGASRPQGVPRTRQRAHTRAPHCRALWSLASAQLACVPITTAAAAALQPAGPNQNRTSPQSARAGAPCRLQVVLDPAGQHWLLTGTSRGHLRLWDVRFLLRVNSWQHPSRSAGCQSGGRAMLARQELLDARITLSPGLRACLSPHDAIACPAAMPSLARSVS